MLDTAKIDKDLSISKEQRIELLLKAAVERHQGGQLEAAHFVYEEILTIDSKNIVALQLYGVLASQVKQFDVAINLLNRALSLSPNYTDALLNRGTVFQELQRFDDAVADFTRVILLKPNYVEAYFNRGNALRDLGQFEKALKDYEKALTMRPNYTDVIANTLELLTLFDPEDSYRHPLLLANKAVRKLSIRPQKNNFLSDDHILTLIDTTTDILRSLDRNIEIENTQIYRRNKVSLNCERHKSIFDQHNIIPKFCFGCFKVQIEPKTLLDFMKLFIIFDWLKLERNNTRKCIIELRPKINGFSFVFKGLGIWINHSLWVNRANSLI